MEPYLLEWLNLLVRWAHVVVGIAWIGASFYFIWLDNHLEPSQDPKLAGEVWAIHGGGFYNARKFQLGPDRLPADAALVQVGSVLDLDHRLRAARADVLRAGRALPDRSGGDGAVQAGCHRHRRRRDGGRICRLRRIVPFTPGEERQPAGASPAGAFVARRMGVEQGVQRPRRFHPLRRDPRHHHGGERRPHHHPRAAAHGRSAARRPRAGRARRGDGQAAQRPQHLLHAAGAVRDDREPLRHRVRPSLGLGGPGGDDRGGRAGPRLVRDAAQRVTRRRGSGRWGLPSWYSPHSSSLRKGRRRPPRWTSRQ